MKTPLRLVALACAWSLLASSPACACGVCVEDKVAATYDHAVIQRADARGQVVVFAAIEGPGDRQALALAAKDAAIRTRGVDRASVRAAAEPTAVSFALDPALVTPEAAIAAIERAARQPGLKLAVLRVVR